jgi:hypothetical protein
MGPGNDVERYYRYSDNNIIGINRSKYCDRIVIDHNIVYRSIDRLVYHNIIGIPINRSCCDRSQYCDRIVVVVVVVVAAVAVAVSVTVAVTVAVAVDVAVVVHTC